MTTCEVNPDGNYPYYGNTNCLFENYRKTTKHSLIHI